MVTLQEIETYIQNIPSAQGIVRQTLTFVQNGELAKAAKCAEEDPSLKLYLKTLVNRPAYGFRNEITDIFQIFSILGTAGAQQILYNYLLHLIAPAKWSLFALSPNAFFDLQASLGAKWEKILTHLNLSSRDNQSAISLLPASIIVCDALFGSHIEEVNQLRHVKSLDFDTILKRLTGYSLFDLCTLIAQKWEMPSIIENIVYTSSGVLVAKDQNELILGKWMHLLFFYELSQTNYLEAGINEFIEFKPEFVNEIFESFTQVVGYNESGC